MTTTQMYDLAIIGAGSGGVTAAPFAARAGAKVALIEKHRIGGDCTWTGCVPSKALIKAAKVAHAARTAANFGLQAEIKSVNLKLVMDYVRQSIQTIYQTETPEALHHDGVDVHLGTAKFADPHTLIIHLNDHLNDGAQPYAIEARHIVICVGGRAAVPAIAGLRDVPFRTNETIFDIDALPQHLLVLGGGPTGLETAQAFRRLGSEVTVIQDADRLLPKDEPEASELILRTLRDEGVIVHQQTHTTAAMMRDGQIVLKTSSGEVAGDMLLVAVGRTPNADTLDLHKAGVAFTDKGITVDEQLRTNVKHIFAAGDVIGGPQFTHVAAFQAFTATRNALFPGASTGQITNVPWTTFTDPEVARAGMSEEQAQEKFGAEGIDVRRWNMDRVDRAVTESDTSGFIKVVHKKDGTVVGATIVAERAGEIIHEWALAIERKWKVGDIAGTMHVYPTYAIANQQLASSYAIDAFMESTVAKLFNRLSRIFQWVLADRGSCLLG